MDIGPVFWPLLQVQVAAKQWVPNGSNTDLRYLLGLLGLLSLFGVCGERLAVKSLALWAFGLMSFARAINVCVYRFIHMHIHIYVYISVCIHRYAYIYVYTLSCLYVRDQGFSILMHHKVNIEAS